jgi:prepilin-type N-terminal cleavage/methylation domain-containing protein
MKIIASRAGFSLIELVMALLLIGVGAGTVIPAVGRTLSRTRLQRAAHVVATDLQLAHSTAARRRAPIRMTVDTVNRVVRIVDHVTPTTVYVERRYDSTSEYAVQRFAATPTTIVFFPNGLANDTVRFTLTGASETRLVRMSRAGQIRFTQ